MIGTVVFRKTKPTTLEQDVRTWLVDLRDRQLSELAGATVKTIQEQITNSIFRYGSTGRLAKAFFSEQTPEGGYGIGNIDYLNTNVKYWSWINDGVAQSGRRIPPMTVGHFEPGNPEPSRSALRTDRFIHSSEEGNYLLIPHKPIEAKNYIEHTLAKMFSEVPSILRGLK